MYEQIDRKPVFIDRVSSYNISAKLFTCLLKDSRSAHFLHFASRTCPESDSMGMRALLSAGALNMPPRRII
jgi:hypothetical protein